MLIVSKHRDYYDSAIGMGIDKSIVYNRHTIKNEVIPKDTFKNYSITFFDREVLGYWGTDEDNKNRSIIIIGFCGKLYVGYKFEWYDEKHNLTNETFFFNGKQDKLINNIDFTDKNGGSLFNFDKSLKFNKDGFISFVNKIQNLDLTHIFRKYNTPVFVFDNSKPYYSDGDNRFIINPVLKEYSFAQVFDPYTAFQEIQMYISGVLGTNNDGDDVVMNEKNKVQQHGFDKWSFRKPPQ